MCSLKLFLRSFVIYHNDFYLRQTKTTKSNLPHSYSMRHFTSLAADQPWYESDKAEYDTT